MLAFVFAVATGSKKGGGAPGSSGGQLKEEVLRINNSTSDFTNSNNFTRSGNDYARHVPSHLKEPQTPVKYPLSIPEAEAASKKLATPTPPPEFSSPPGKSQPSVFTFTPSSIHMSPHASSTPKCPQYGSSVAGASAYSSSDSSYQDPGENPSQTDPNLKLNYKARVYLTNSQRQAYGRNILARMPSIDGSKSKYIVEHPGRVSSVSMYASDSLPRASYQHRRQDMVQLDTELGCSQC